MAMLKSLVIPAVVCIVIIAVIFRVAALRKGVAGFAA